MKIKKHKRANGVIIYTLENENKIIAQSSNIKLLKTKKNKTN